jgi:hypothetical protein
MTDREHIDDQVELLRVHRQTLANLLKQEAQLSSAYAPPGIGHGIREARASIRHIKQSLRTRGIRIEDHPNDRAPTTDDASNQRRLIAGHPSTPEPQRKLIRRIVPVDRDTERRNFQRMLRREIPWRGMIIHSNGEGGWGKTSLLKIFDEECADCPSPLTEALLFTPGDTGANWKLIMERTVRAVGESYFPRYRAASADRTAHDHGYSLATHEEGIDTHDSGDELWRTVGGDTWSSDRLRPLDGRSDQVRLTPVFIEEFQAAPKPEQFVWLIDAVEHLDDDTVIWLRKIFKHIVLGELQNTILVLAGRHRFNSSSFWGNHIKQTRLGPLNIPAVVDLLEQGGWDGTKQERRIVAKQLIEQTGGKPHAIRGLLDRMLIEQEE